MDAGWGSDFSRALVNVSEVCTRVNFAVFKDGQRVKYKNQAAGDEGFGTYSLTLEVGNYQLLILAHSGKANPTTTNPAKLQFTNPGSSSGTGYTDTFYYYGDLVVTSEVQSYDLTLTRAVAMFRLVLTDDEMPSNVAKLKFYYLGGSSTFSPKDGCGCVNSKQTEIRPVSDDGIYEIFTLPHTEDDVLTKLTVTALDQNDNIIKEKVFENVPVTRNQITRYTGSFFGSGGSGGSSDGTIRLTADPDWDSVNGYTF
jgi:hypothetical protein